MASTRKYEEMKLRIANQLTAEVVSELSALAGFPPNKSDKVKDGTSFLKELESQCKDEMTFCGTLRVLLENHGLNREASIVKQYSKECVSGKCLRAQISKREKLTGYLKRTPKAAKLAFEHFKDGIHQADNPKDDNSEPKDDNSEQDKAHRTADNSPEIFISFNFKTKPRVEEIKAEIERRTGLKCWMCVEKIYGGDMLNEEIVAGIYAAKVMLCMMTQDYVNSIECEKEFYFAESINLPMVYVHLEEMHYPFKCKRGETERISGINLAYARSLYCELYENKQETEEAQYHKLVESILNILRQN